MKRSVLIPILFLFIGFSFSLHVKANSTTTPAPTPTQDTILIKLPNGVTMTLYVKDTEQLKSLREYKFDSLMELMSKYAEQAERASTGQQPTSKTMVVNTTKEIKKGDGPEKVKIMVVSRSEQVTNSQGNNRVKVMVEYDEKIMKDSIRVTKQQKNKLKRTKFESTLDLGFNTFIKDQGANGDVNPDNPGLYDLKPMGSRYFSFTQYLQTRVGGEKSPFYFRPGVEIAFNNFMFDRNHYIVDNNGVTEIVKETNRSFEKSKLATSFLNIPVMGLLKFHDRNGKEGFKLGFGGFAGYRLGTHSKLKYDREGKTYKDKERNSYNVDDFQYGLSFSIGYRDLELFAKYNLSDLFKENRGPNFNVLSFGFRL
ncbi:outer membrane beta-barrel protein [Adhaeribacter aquaticus]|uniref:outer membrane beta-barrel protein n=1 Tax=Adhaeribacter aquaticus TaxID=299567 RepID=UPI00041FE634|nr:outer membrane beta-barrel protein [Adhaeribacter aquaticus]